MIPDWVRKGRQGDASGMYWGWSVPSLPNRFHFVEKHGQSGITQEGAGVGLRALELESHKEQV